MSIFTMPAPRWAIAGVAAVALLVSGCSSAGTPSPAATTLTESKTLTVVTHDSFNLDDATKAKFAAETGYTVTYVAPGDAGTTVNQLVLTKDSPMGDVVYGIDNTFAGRAISTGILRPYNSPALPESAKAYEVGTDAQLTPIDHGEVCVNADASWYKAKGLAVPKTLDDLTKPEYKGQLVAMNPASSSPGLAFLMATVAAKGDPGYLDYWKQLKANGMKVSGGWSDAYSNDFTASSKGAYPLMVSYSSSPVDSPKAVVLTDTCFGQVEYAGVIAGAQNAVGAQKFIDFMLSHEVQAQLPEQMYMYPVDATVALPASWERYAAKVDKPLTLPVADIDAGRTTWIKAWTAAVIG